MPDATFADPSAVLALWFGDGWDLGWRCFNQLHADVPDSLKPAIQSQLEAATEHRDIIARFGRFPHRNAVLGRASTASEPDFLAHGPRFGQ